MNTLFDNPPAALADGPYTRAQTAKGLARRTDPPTSRIAAEKHTASGKRFRNKALILALVQQYPGRTAVELDALVSERDRKWITRHEISRRLPELVEEQLVTRGEARKCRIANTRQLTWWAVPVGRRP